MLTHLLTDAPAVMLDDVQAAAGRLQGQAIKTPLLSNHALDERVGARIFLKPECLQRTGSFKFRGAYNRLSQMTPEERRAGVVAFSSGNHAQGVALAAKLLGMPATIVMPSDAPVLKIEGTRKLGGEIILYDRATQSREMIAQQIAEARGATLVPSFDDPAIIAGQGTAGLEIAQDLKARDITPDHYVCCLGGGGLAGGTALAMKAYFPALQVTTVEPEHYDDGARSLATGIRVGIGGYVPTVCDALQTPMIGAMTYPLLRAAGATGLWVTDAEALDAVRYAAATLKLVLEPGGAVALAALLSGRLSCEGQTVVVMLSGGNIDPAVLAEALATR